MGSGLDNPDWGSAQKGPEHKEGTLNYTVDRSVVMKVCFILMVTNLQLWQDAGYHVLYLHYYLLVNFSFLAYFSVFLSYGQP